MKKATLLASIGVLILSSCQKDLDTNDTTSYKQAENVDEMVVSSDFDWKMTKTVELNLSSHSNAIIRVLGEYGQSIEKAYVPAEKVHHVKLEVPSHMQNIEVMFGRNKVLIPIDGATVDYRLQ